MDQGRLLHEKSMADINVHPKEINENGELSELAIGLIVASMRIKIRKELKHIRVASGGTINLSYLLTIDIKKETE